MPYDPKPADAARLKMFHLIADKIERDSAWLQTGLDNIARWIANGSTQQDKLREARLLERGKISPGALRERWSSMNLGEKDLFQSGLNLAKVTQGIKE